MALLQLALLSHRGDMLHCKSPLPLAHYPGFKKKKPKWKRGNKEVTLFAAEEDSDIISRQLLCFFFSFHFSVVFISFSSLPEPTQQRQQGQQSDRSARCCGRSCFSHTDILLRLFYLLSGSMARLSA